MHEPAAVYQSKSNDTETNRTGSEFVRADSACSSYDDPHLPIKHQHSAAFYGLPQIRLTNDHVYPLNFAQERTVFDDILESCQQDLEALSPKIKLKLSAHSRRAFVHDCCNRGCPFREFESPVSER